MAYRAYLLRAPHNAEQIDLHLHSDLLFRQRLKFSGQSEASIVADYIDSLELLDR